MIRNEWCVGRRRFLTSPSCIKRGTRGAKPGVPHKRRQRPDAAMTTSSSGDVVVAMSAQPCVTQSSNEAMSFLYASSLASPTVKDTRPYVSEFSIEQLTMSSASYTSSSASSVDSCDVSVMTSCCDVTLLTAPLPVSHLLVDNVVCWQFFVSWIIRIFVVFIPLRQTFANL